MLGGWSVVVGRRPKSMRCTRTGTKGIRRGVQGRSEHTRHCTVRHTHCCVLHASSFIKIIYGKCFLRVTVYAAL